MGRHAGLEGGSKRRFYPRFSRSGKPTAECRIHQAVLYWAATSMFEQSKEASDDRQGAESPKGPPPQFTLRQLFLLTTLVAVACSLAACLGWAWIALALAPAAGAFLGGLACPWVGLDYVLDDIQADVFRCLAVGVYTAVVFRIMVPVGLWLALTLFAGAGWWVPLILFLGGGVFLLGLVMLVLWLWPLADKGEIVVVAGTALFGAVVAVVWLPLQFIRF